jgi:quercetin dioxygenase-like cupin family protein
MKYLRIYAAADGGSRMETVEIATASTEAFPGYPRVDISAKVPTNTMSFFRLPAGWSAGWHNPPERRYVITTAGAAEIGTKDGKTAILRAGDVARFDNTSGTGHHTRVLDAGPWEGIAVNLPE